MYSDATFRSGSRRTLTPVIKILLYANIIIFLLEVLVAPPVRAHLVALLGLSVQGLRARAFWQLGTYMFLHGSTTHLFMNMLALYLIGPALERSLGRKLFLVLYLFSGVLGGIGFLLMDPQGVCIGASGAVFGVFGAFVALYPRERMVLLFLPFIQFEAWVFALIFIGIELLYLVAGRGGNIAHSAHVAGAVAGFVFMRVLMRRAAHGRGGFRPLSSFFRFRGGRADSDPYAAMDRYEVDRILDKVAESGIGSLTRSEREVLEASSRGRRGV